MAVIHCQGHQKTNTPEATGNAFADQAAKQAAHLLDQPLTILPILSHVDVSFPDPELPPRPHYNLAEEAAAEAEGATQNFHGWQILPTPESSSHAP